MKDIKIIEKCCKEIGDSFYILNTQQFRSNYIKLLGALSIYYDNCMISYSYKTNYIPRLCSIIDELGGYAEVVSDMEMNIAKSIGVPLNKIVFNGPYKKEEAIQELLFNDGILNLDSMTDFNVVKEIVINHPNRIFGCGIRCNFDVGDSIISRFGFDTKGEDFKTVLRFFESQKNIILRGIHIHFATRSLTVWRNKVKELLKLIEKLQLFDLEYLSVGGGLYGHMDEALKSQFGDYIPTFEEYAEVISYPVGEFYKHRKKKPILFLEPGSALVGDCMEFVSKVISIKNIREKSIATLLGSIYNINPTLNKKNPPIRVLHLSNDSNIYSNLDFGGYTCIETDYLYRGYNGNLCVNDYVIFGNVGSYSVVLKPPFILPNFCVIEINEMYEISIVKRKEKFDDLFTTYAI